MIAARYGTSISALVKANNLTNRHKLSIGQQLLVPVAGSHEYTGASTNVTTQSPSKNYARAEQNHTVQRGDTPSEIADRYDIPLSELYAANNLNRRSVIKVGQVLKIPGNESDNLEGIKKTETKTYSYTVKQGDTPLHIAIEHGMTLNQFLELNGMSKNSVIYPGQTLKVAAESGTSTKSRFTHTVNSGESLWSIARKYDVSVSDLVYWNGYSSSNKTLHPGDKVTIIRNGSGSTVSSESLSKIVHTVRSGESLYKIANQYDVSIEKIREWNNKKGSALAIGEKLTIYVSGAEKPKPSPTTGRQVIHKIRKGDTLWDIAQKYNVTTHDILAQNGISDPEKLRVGDELKIFIE